MIMFQKVFKLWRGHELASETIKGKYFRKYDSESFFLSFLYATHRHDLFYITVKYHDTVPKGIQVTEGTRICIKNIKGEITKK